MPTSDELTNNIRHLTQALTALNANMFGTLGVRPDALGGTGGLIGARRPGQGTNNDPHKDAIKQIATNTLLQKTINSNTETMKYLIRDQKKNIQDLGKYTAIAGKFFADSIKKFSVKELDVELPKKLNSAFDRTLGKGVVPTLQNYEDVVRLTTRSNMSNLNAARQLYREYANGTKTIEQVTPKIEKFGYTIEEMAQDVRDGGQKFDKQVGQASVALALFSADLELAASRGQKIARTLEIFGGLVIAAGKLQYDAAVAAMKYGTQVTTLTLEQAARAGMSATQLIETQNQNIQAIHSSGMTFGQFNENLDEASKRLFLYTGKLSDGAKVWTSAFDTFRSLSNNTANQNSFINQQELLFVKLNRTLGMTSEQFSALNSFILSNANIQAQMYKISKDQRIAAIQGLQEQYEKLRLDGLTDEQAKKLVDTLNQLTGASLKNRFTEAAKIQGVLGALGMGHLGGEAAEIIRKGQRATPQERERLAEIQVEAQRRVSQQYAGANYGQEASLDALTQVVGNFLGPQSAGAAAAMSQGKQITQQTAHAVAQTDALGNINASVKKDVLATMEVAQAVNSVGGKIIHTLEELMALYVGGKVGSIISGKLGNLGGSLLTKLFPAEFAGGVGLGTAALGTLGVAGAGAGGYLLGKGINTIPKWFGSNMEISDYGGEALNYLFGPKAHPTARVNVRALRRKEIAEDLKQITALQAEQAANPTQKVAEQIESLKNEIKRLQELQQKQIDATKKVGDNVKQGNDQSVVQTDQHVQVLKKLRGARDTNRTPPRV